MTELKSTKTIYLLDDWIVDENTLTIRRKDQTKSIRPKVMEVLITLLRNAPNTISRDDLTQQVWQGNHAISEQAINNAIWSIRNSLEDKADSPKYLQTIPKKGFRIIAQTRVLPASKTHDNPLTSRHSQALTTALSIFKINRFKSIWIICLIALVSFALFITNQNFKQNAFNLPKIASTKAHWDTRNIKPLTTYKGKEYIGQLSPNGSMLAFAWWKNAGVGSLFINETTPSTQSPVKISHPNNDVFSLSWSPDSEKIAYSANSTSGGCSVWIYSIKSANHTKLTSCARITTPILAWSPTGNTIAVTRFGDSGLGIYLTNVNTGKSRILIQSDQNSLVDYQPTWVDNGKALAFVRVAKDGTKDIYLNDLNGSIQRLTHSNYLGFHGLTWSPLENALIYSITQQNSRTLWKFSFADNSISSLGITGSAPQVLQNTLLFSSLENRQSLALITVNSKQPNLLKLTDSMGMASSPVYSKAANKIAYTAQRARKIEIWIADSSGASPKMVAQIEGIVQHLNWSKQGDLLAFVGNCGQNKTVGLCLIDAESGEVLELLANAGHLSRPVWSESGEHLYLIARSNQNSEIVKFDIQNRQIELTTSPEEPTNIKQMLSGDKFLVTTKSSDAIQLWSPKEANDSQSFPIPNIEKVIAWTPFNQEILLIYREKAEEVKLFNPYTGEMTNLVTLQLGTLVEYPQISQGPNGFSFYSELVNSSFADLMQTTLLKSAQK
ncbi:winged helix-turn-helix domain-containing protein [Aliikangiella sp. IMCC44653]